MADELKTLLDAIPCEPECTDTPLIIHGRSPKTRKFVQLGLAQASPSAQISLNETNINELQTLLDTIPCGSEGTDTSFVIYGRSPKHLQNLCRGASPG